MGTMAFVMMTAALAAQSPVPAVDALAPLRFLEGAWLGEGDGRPGYLTGVSTFQFEASGKVLIRRSVAEQPAEGARPASRHEDFMVCFWEGGQLKALYVDNEGHVIRYVGASVAEGVAFTSEPGPGPRFRLTYRMQADGAVELTFEVAPPGTETFRTYLRGRLRRKG